MDKKIQALRKSLEKNHISTTISEPDVWLSSGNMALNFIMTGDFTRGIPNRRTIMYWGLPGTGKSFLAALAAKEAQDKGYFVVYFDTEDAIHTEYMEKIGVNMDEDHFLPIRVATLEEATVAVSDILNTFNEDEKVCYVMDSLTGLTTNAEAEDFDKGKTTTDMGLFAKRAKLFIKNVNNKIGSRDNFFIITNHAYMNQDKMSGDGKVIPSGGQGIIFIPSITVNLSKLKLKEASTKAGVKPKITGVKITADISKSRFTQLGGSVRLEVPYDKGIDPIDGLLGLAIDAGIVDNKKSKGWNIFEHEGEEIKFRKADFHKHYQKLFDVESPSEIVETDEEE